MENMGLPNHKLNSLLKHLKIESLLISSTANITYLTNYSNFSAEEREAFLFITKNMSYIITDGRYAEAVRIEVPHFELIERSSILPLSTILQEIKKKHKIEVLGIEEDNLSVKEYKAFKKIFKKTTDFSLSNLRQIKTIQEINNIKKACQIADDSLSQILKQINPNTTELELAQLLEAEFKKRFTNPSFSTIIAFAKNSAIPHHQTGKTKLGKPKGQFVLFDLGVRYKNYCSDMTRTFFYGTPSKKQIDIYNTVLESQQKAADYIKNTLQKNQSISAKKADEIARESIQQKGYTPYSHGLGHGVGVEIHEAPRLASTSKDILKEGMVFSIEPGIYLPGFGGVRIEDLFVIQNNNLTQLTKSPKTLTIL